MRSILLIAFITFKAILCFSQARYYVRQAASGANNGQSWANAFADLQQALAQASMGDSIWVAEGKYLPTPGVSRDSSFILPSGVTLLGGFSGTESDIFQRDWQAHPSVLSGDIGVADDSTDNAYTILYLSNPAIGTVIDGFIFRGGIADNPESGLPFTSPKKCGGAIYIMAQDGQAYPDIQNCIFENNYAFLNGGAVYINGEGTGSVAPRFINCIFKGNRARMNGGGVYRNGSGWTDRYPDFQHCVFEENWANRSGGGLFYYDRERSDSMELIDCKFIKNTANQVTGGGASFNLGRQNKGSVLKIKRCDFVQNTGFEGGAIGVTDYNALYTDFIHIDSCRFINNNTGNQLIWLDIINSTDARLWFTSSLFEGNNATSISNISFAYSGKSQIVGNNKFIDNNTPTLMLLNGNGQIGEAICENNVIINATPVNAFQLHGKNQKLILNNTFQAPGGTFIATANNVAQNVLVYNNEVISNWGTFIEVRPKAVVNCINNTIKVNTVVKVEHGLTDMVRMMNNHMERAGNLADLFQPDSANSKLLYLAHNALDTTWYCEINWVDCGPGNLFGQNPMFRDTANGDYSLSPCSPLINKGANAAAAGILSDFNGNPRIQEDTVDIGAFESPAFTLGPAPSIQPACTGFSNGSISISPENGCEPLTYHWQPAAGDGPTLNGLPPGQYSVTISDGKGRQIADTIQVTEAPLPSLALNGSDVHCVDGQGGTLSAGATGGTAPFHYLWSPPAPDTALLAHLAPGTYALTLSDANGCQDSASTYLRLDGALSLMIDGQSISCHGAADAWLSATPVTGAAPFAWQWTGWPGADSVAQPLGPGQYAVTVSDVYGCTASNTFPPTNDPAPLNISTMSQPQTSAAPPNGSVMGIAMGGTPDYQYHWNTGDTLQNLGGLTAGIYSLSVTDAHGCSATAEVEVKLMLGTKEAAEQAVMVYPNPSADWVRVELRGYAGPYTLEMSDLQGRVLLRRELLSGERISLEGLPAGVYVLRARVGDGADFLGVLVRGGF